MAKKTQKASIDQVGVPVPIPIEWRTDGVPAVFANHMLVQVDEHECHLSFFEIKPPLIVGSPEERKAAVEKLTSVPATCVGRVVITRTRLQGFVDAINETVKQLKNVNSEPKNGAK